MDKPPSGNLIPSQGSIFRDFALRTRLILRLMGDGRVNFLLKLLPIGALVYLISPLDFIPNAIAPIIGTADDIAIVWAGLYLFLEMCPPGVVREHLQDLLGGEITPAVRPSEEGEVIDGEVIDIKESRENS
ncbi:MAG: YkvA family protein [Anaerolineales bacterium]|nr:YkvA family protein [Anaerolineales bacterium]MCX7754278.1 YkvA family protein [Anaerolineales bacterium]MDW8278687.1 YkvA family protein [Anaerolineales bacterium]